MNAALRPSHVTREMSRARRRQTWYSAAFFAAVADFFDVIFEFIKSDKQSGVNSAIAKWVPGVVEERSAVGIDCRMAKKKPLQISRKFLSKPSLKFFW